MRAIAIEEHFTAPHLVSRIDPEVVRARGYRPRRVLPGTVSAMELAAEIGPRRIGLMDESGISLQVLSNTGPGPDLLPGEAGIVLAREMNDYLAEKIATAPDRFAGFAVLPMAAPEACAVELGRCVTQHGFKGALINGTTEGRFLDHPAYDGLLAEAVSLDVPIYIHPHMAPAAVREAYFTGLEPLAERTLEAAGWGWHSETAIHVYRLVLAGTLDKHPKLKLIIGHMGEMLPMMLARADEVFAADIDHLARPISRQILDQVWITTSGIFTEPPFIAALLTFGIDRILFSVDYPYAQNAKGRAFLDRIALAPADMEKLAWRNAVQLLGLPAPA